MSVASAEPVSVILPGIDAGPAPQVIDAGPALRIELPVDRSLTGAEFGREGHDLIIDGAGGRTIVVREYFAQESPPALVTEDGLVLQGTTVARLAGPLAPGQVAQTDGAADVAIGRVTGLDGEAVATRVDGTRATLAVDSPVYQGDVLETGDGGALNVVFVDNTSFSLGANARMVIDELVYDPSSGTGQAAFSMVEGLFVFVSGEVADSGPDAMTLSTPVATIGIRGTGLGIQAAAEGIRNLISLIVDTGGKLGSAFVSNDGGNALLDEVNETTAITSFTDAPSSPFILSEQQVLSLFQAPLNLSPFGGALKDVGGDTEGDEGREGEGDRTDSGEGATNVTNAGGEDDPFGLDVAFLSGLLGPNPLLDALNKLYVPQLSDDSGGIDAGDRLNQGDQELLVFAPGAGGGGRLGIGTDGDDILDAFAFGTQDIANLLVGFGGNDTITGGNLNDFMFGNNGNDSLIGGTGLGNDIIDGGADTDTLLFTSTAFGVNVDLDFGFASGSETGFDTISDIENVVGGAGNDFITGDANANVLIGGAGNDHLRGLDGDDVLQGGLGDDQLTDGAGNDVLDGGAGNDTASFADNLQNGVVADLGTGTATGSVNTLIDIENLTGTNIFDDHLIGDGGANILNGLSGNDLLEGQGGDDSLIGGNGNDSLLGAAGEDILNGGFGDDVLNGGADFDFADFSTSFSFLSIDLGAAGAQATGEGNDTFISIEGIKGGFQADDLFGDNADNAIFGNNGDDLIQGNGGNDELHGGFGFRDTVDFSTSGNAVNVNLLTGIATGQGNDTLDGFEDILGSGQGDTLTGDGNDNRILGFNGADNIDGGAGSDSQLDGGAGNDQVDGGAGNDRLIDGAGVDNLDGGADNDTLEVTADGTDNDVFDGGAGNDTLDLIQAGAATTVNLAAGTINGGGFVGGIGDTVTNVENVIGSSQSDTITGDGNANSLFGNGDDDVIDGGAGNDFIDDGAGVDTVQGGNDNDTVRPTADATNGDAFDGGAGTDTLDLSFSNGAVINLNLQAGTLSGGGFGNDTVANFEIVFGSFGFDAIITRNGSVDSIFGGFGDDQIAGGLDGDNDFLDGGAGTVDTIDYGGALNLVVVNLAGNLAVGVDIGTDTIFGFERVLGGAGSDTLTGNDFSNIIEGGNGADVIHGGVGAAFDFDVLNGDGGNDTINGGVGNDTINGGSGIDQLFGDAGNDVLIGGEGNDALLDGGADFDAVNYSAIVGIGIDVDLTAVAGEVDRAGDIDNLVDIERIIGTNQVDTFAGDGNGNSFEGLGGNDIIAGAGGDDQLEGGNGDDQINGDAGADFIEGGANNDTINGGTEDDILNGDAGNDALNGDAGNDVLAGGAGDDTIDGGADNDTASYADIFAAVTVDLAIVGAQNTGGGGTDTLSNIENITGGVGGDHVLGDGGNNILDGSFGDDSLNGRGGNDSLIGGAGTDLADFSGGAAVNVNLLLGTATGQGSDSLSGIEDVLGSANADTIRGDGNANLLQGGNGNDNLFGEGGDDQLEGGNNNDNLDGGDGNDILLGGAGTDVIDGGAGNDLIDGGAGNDQIDGGAGFDSMDLASATGATNVNLTAGTATGAGLGTDSVASIEQVLGSAFVDTVIGTGAAEAFFGNNGNDVLNGAGGNDFLGGGDGDDVLIGGDGSDSLFGNNNNDDLDGGAGNDNLDGGAGNDAIVGGAGDDSLSGANDDDVLDGGAGDDFVDGGAGADVLRGGDGDDRLRDNNSAGNTTYDGGAGSDTVDFQSFTGPLNIDLNVAGPQTTGTHDATFIGIENLIGTFNADTFTGNASDNIFRGGQGDDILNGGAGLDIASFADATNRIFVDLNNAVQDRIATLGTDTLNSIEGVIGGQFRDVLTGTDGANVLQGGFGADILTGGALGDFFRYAATNEGGVVNANQTAQTFNNGTFGDFIFDFESGIDKFVFDTDAFGLPEGALDPSRFVFLAGSYDGTNSGVGANTPVFIFSDNDGNLYFDNDTATAGYSVIANVLAGTVTAGDITVANVATG